MLFLSSLLSAAGCLACFWQKTIMNYHVKQLNNMCYVFLLHSWQACFSTLADTFELLTTASMHGSTRRFHIMLQGTVIHTTNWVVCYCKEVKKLSLFFHYAFSFSCPCAWLLQMGWVYDLLQTCYAFLCILMHVWSIFAIAVNRWTDSDYQSAIVSYHQTYTPRLHFPNLIRCILLKNIYHLTVSIA